VAKKKGKPLTHGELLTRLRSRYVAPEWVTLTEVQPECGFMDKPRRTDLLGISTFPSRGLRMAGFELKSSRADVLKELREPEKAEAMQRFCHLWYLVVGRADLVGLDELPPNWGLIVPHGVGLRVKKNAPVLEPEPWPPGLTHGLIRKAFGNSIEDIEREKIRREAFAQAQQSNGYTTRRLEELERNVRAFQSVSGIQIDAWVNEERVKEQAALLRVVLRDGLEGHRQRARRLAEQLEKVGGELRAALGNDPA
jgi:hypothetical protein